MHRKAACGVHTGVSDAVLPVCCVLAKRTRPLRLVQPAEHADDDAHCCCALLLPSLRGRPTLTSISRRAFHSASGARPAALRQHAGQARRHAGTQAGRWLMAASGHLLLRSAQPGACHSRSSHAASTAGAWGLRQTRRDAHVKCAAKSSCERLLGGMKSSRRLTTRPLVSMLTRSSSGSLARYV